MREITLFSGKIHTAGTNFTLPPVVTAATNLNSGHWCLYALHKVQIWTVVTDALRTDCLNEWQILKDSATQLLIECKGDPQDPPDPPHPPDKLYPKDRPGPHNPSEHPEKILRPSKDIKKSNIQHLWSFENIWDHLNTSWTHLWANESILRTPKTSENIWEYLWNNYKHLTSFW